MSKKNEKTVEIEVMTTVGAAGVKTGEGMPDTVSEALAAKGGVGNVRQFSLIIKPPSLKFRGYLGALSLKATKSISENEDSFAAARAATKMCVAGWENMTVGSLSTLLDEATFDPEEHLEKIFGVKEWNDGDAIVPYSESGKQFLTENFSIAWPMTITNACDYALECERTRIDELLKN